MRGAEHLSSQQATPTVPTPDLASRSMQNCLRNSHLTEHERKQGHLLVQLNTFLKIPFTIMNEPRVRYTYVMREDANPIHMISP